jgi:hypothetical protein
MCEKLDPAYFEAKRAHLMNLRDQLQSATKGPDFNGRGDRI